MTKIEDMSEPERQSWITFLADGAVFIWFWQKMTIGLSPQPIHTNMDEFGSIVVSLIIITVILHAAIAAVFDVRKRKESFEKDERDVQIERLGAHWGYRLMQWGLGGIVVMMLTNSLKDFGYAPPLTIEKPAEIIFALLVVSYVADLVKHGLMIKAYRS